MLATALRWNLFKSFTKHDTVSIHVLDVGHGDSLLLTDRNKGFLFDCGTLYPRKHLDVPKHIEMMLSAINNNGLLVSHYHFDHYSFIRYFQNPGSLFSRIYVPDLPVTGPANLASRAIRNFLKLSVTTKFSHYHLLPELYSRVHAPIIPCRKGDAVRCTGNNLRVIWPDFTHPIFQSRPIQQRAKSIINTCEPYLEEMDLRPIPEDTSVTRFFQYLDYLNRREVPYDVTRIKNILEEMETAFQDLADTFSIVANSWRKRFGRLLFLGDIKEAVLNSIHIPGKREYTMIKAAHHGTRFGKSLNDLSTEFLVISRDIKEFPRLRDIHKNYYKSINAVSIISTEHLSHSIIL